MIKVDFLNKANLQENYAHSMLISLLRGLAALQVAAAHLRAQVFPGYGTIAHPTTWFQGLAFATGFAHQAVVIFFLLSGWLVGGSLLNKIGGEHCIRNYTIDRMTRLWIVLIPTFAAMVMFHLAAGTINPNGLDPSGINQYSLGTLLGNLVGMQNIIVPTFGGNFPLWSLSNETWYYVLFPLLVALFTTKSTVTRLLTLLAVLTVAQLLSADILLYFLPWLLGAAFSRVRITTNIIVRLLMLVLFVTVSFWFRVKGKNDDLSADTIVQDLIFSIPFLLFLSSMQQPLTSRSAVLEQINRVGKFFANFSFTLYVLHVPLIGAIVFFSHPFFHQNRLQQDNPVHWAIYFGMYGAIVIASYLFYIPFEASTYRVRQKLKKVFVVRRTVRQA
jgi:peptidoglycan/LPS O-acetylase OafA/YrhL